MIKVNLHKVVAYLSAILKRVIARSGHPIARISPLASGKRQPGSAKGQLIVSETFIDPLPPDVIKEFEQ